MGIFFWPMEIYSTDGQRVATVQAMVDTGSSYTVLPTEILRRLGVDSTDALDFELGDGSIVALETGEVRIRVEGRDVTGGVVFGADRTTPLMGSDILQKADLLVDPVAHRLIPRSSLL